MILRIKVLSSVENIPRTSRDRGPFLQWDWKRGFKMAGIGLENLLMGYRPLPNSQVIDIEVGAREAVPIRSNEPQPLEIWSLSHLSRNRSVAAVLLP